MLFLKRIMSVLLAIGLGCLSTSALADYTYNMALGATEVSQDVYHLHMTIFWICVAIGVVVFGVMIYALLKHRHSRGVQPAEFHESTAIEIVWTIIPFAILIAMAIPATIVLKRMNDTSAADLSIQITGYQWKWQYTYLDNGLSFFSNLATSQDQIHNQADKDPHYLREVDKELVVPVHKKIRLLMSAHDVIHSWWVPELGVKQDAIPGFINETWTRLDKPGIYRGQCAELCGAGHGYMPIVLKAVTAEEFNKWISDQKVLLQKEFEDTEKVWTHDELMKKGQADYEGHCAVCHQVTGMGVPGAFPALKGSHVTTGPVIKHIDKVLNGVPGTAMQAFANQLSNSELAAIITYERNAWGNNTGDTVQPKQIKAEKDRLKG